ncbi:MAG: transcriptional repressor LexA [Chloroflexi bacterium]|nr:transcriptional repressor LexA [Chloroflexota bacterium]
MKAELSPRQKGMLEFMREFMEEHQFPPTVRDIQAGCNISSTSVVDYNLRILQNRGYLRRFADVSRGIELLGSSRPGRDVVRVPIMGNIAAGEPLPIPGSDTWHSGEMETVDLPPFLTKGKEHVFALKVKGTSMIDALIADGDLVLLEPASRASGGEMVAARLHENNEVTLKHFFIENGMVRLQPANPLMDPIFVRADQVSVQGKVVGVVRSV